MGFHHQLALGDVRCSRLAIPSSFSTARQRRLGADAHTGMQPSPQVWRRSAPQQARCRCLSRRPLGTVNLSQAGIVDCHPHMVHVSFKVEYKCPYGQTLSLVGSNAPLGDWSSKRGQRMHWSRGDVWTCNVMLPAGSAVECKYVILDDQGREQRWQEGGNMAVKVPAACQQGLPVQRYDVGVSWCKTHASFRTHPLSTAAEAAATVAERITAQAASAAPGFVATAVECGAGAATAAATAAAASVPVMAWALSKGASVASEPRRLNPAVVAQAAAADPLSSHHQHAPPVTAPAATAKTIASSSPPPADLLHKTVTKTSEAPAVSKVATLLQAAATSVVQETAPAAPGAAAAAAGVPQLPSFQLSPASGSDGEATMSIVLPSRSHSPPVKISLSSNFARLMEMPALARAATAAASPCAVSSPGAANPIFSSSSAAAPVKTAMPAAVQSHAIDLGSAAPPRAPHASNPSGTTSATHSAGQTPASSPAQPQPASSNAAAAAATAAAAVPRQGQSQTRLQAASTVPTSPMWGTEYDVYAAAYGIPYMHTPFDMEVYAVYDHEIPPQPTMALPPSAATTHGSLGSLSGDLLETAVQAARGAVPVTTAAISSPPARATTAERFASDLLIATAASAAMAMDDATAAVPVAAVPPFVAAAAAAPTAATTAADAADAPDVYRHVSRSSTSVSDWAGRTLIEMGSGRTLLDDDSDEDETADEEAAVAQALAAPADMAALLTQLGTALGRSVRLRYDGVDATAQDLLELDRKIALASTKLYRQRDGLLSGWVRKETRRQLATTAAAAPATRPPMPGSNTVTPV